MQGYCPSRSAVCKFRAEAVYIEFMKQWNFGVYFSLRYLAELLVVAVSIELELRFFCCGLLFEVFTRITSGFRKLRGL